MSLIPFSRKTALLLAALAISLYGSPALRAEPAQEPAVAAALEHQKGISLQEKDARRATTIPSSAASPLTAPDERENPLSPVQSEDKPKLTFKTAAPASSASTQHEFESLIQKGLHAGLRLYAELARDHREKMKQARSPGTEPEKVPEIQTDPAAILKEAELSLRTAHEQARSDFKKSMEQAGREHAEALTAAEEAAMNSPAETQLKELRGRLTQLRKEEVAAKIIVLKEKNDPANSTKVPAEARQKLRESVEQDPRVAELHRAIETLLAQITTVKNENHTDQKTAVENKLGAIDAAEKMLAQKREEAEALRKKAFARAQRDFDAVKDRLREEKIAAARLHAEGRDQSTSRDTSLASRYQEDRGKIRAFISEHRTRAREIMESYRSDIMNLGSEGSQRQQAVAAVRKTYQKRLEAFAGLCIKEAHELRIGLGIA